MEIFVQEFTKTKSIQLCPNAYDIKFMDPSEIGLREVDTSKKIIGYFGHLTDRWFDWEFLQKVAESKPEWQFQLIGHPEPTKKQLRPNIIYKGFWGHAEICRIARLWCCGIIPFKIENGNKQSEKGEVIEDTELDNEIEKLKGDIGLFIKF